MCYIKYRTSQLRKIARINTVFTSLNASQISQKIYVNMLKHRLLLNRTKVIILLIQWSLEKGVLRYK